jgi:carbon-monoxide dehydrogenase large subunit
MAYASLIGAHVKRKEDPRLIVGRGSYVGDMKLAGMQYVAFVRTPYPTPPLPASTRVPL